MVRLTKKYSGGYGLVKVKDNEQDLESPYPNTLRACFESWQRLGAYEDTGLMPEEVAAIKDDIDAGWVVRFHPAEEMPSTEDVATYLVIVEHFKTEARRVEFTEFRFGEWDISNGWSLIAWAEYPIFARAALEEENL